MHMVIEDFYLLFLFLRSIIPAPIVKRRQATVWTSCHRVWLITTFKWITNSMVDSRSFPMVISVINEFWLDCSRAGRIISAAFYC